MGFGKFVRLISHFTFAKFPIPRLFWRWEPFPNGITWGSCYRGWLPLLLIFGKWLGPYSWLVKGIWGMRLEFGEWDWDSGNGGIKNFQTPSLQNWRGMGYGEWGMRMEYYRAVLPWITCIFKEQWIKLCNSGQNGRSLFIKIRWKIKIPNVFHICKTRTVIK